jgi:alanyl-tRNA synthetase
MTEGQVVAATINVEARNATRRNHTGTHVLHWALRKVLGEHVKQAGSLVAPDRLRFDFSHYAALTPEEMQQIEQLANNEVLSNSAVDSFETSKDEALAAGAIAFFGDKYGDVVRVLRVGNSIELCGGTHVRATGDIGTIKIVAEGSIGSNLRRIEAVTGEGSVALVQRYESLLAQTAQLVGTKPDDVVAGVQKRMEDMKALQDEIKTLRAQLASGRAGELADSAEQGVVVTRVDGMSPSDLRDLAVAIRQKNVSIVVIGGVTDTGGVSLVSAIGPGVSGAAGDIIKDAAKAVGGGGGGKGDVATAGGKNPAALDEALQIAKTTALAAISGSK